MTHLEVHPLRGGLTGTISVPSDKSIGHRALLLSALATGTSRIGRFSRGEDNLATLAALRGLGVPIDEPGPDEVRVHGVGLQGLRAASRPLDCGNSGTTMRLLCGLLSAQPFGSRLIGDESLSGRPMGRVIGPLCARGGRIVGVPHARRTGDWTAPLEILPLDPGTRLAAIDHTSPVASAQVKSALLLSGLDAEGPTVVREPMLSRDHTERLLRALGVPLEVVGTEVSLDPAGWIGEMPALDADLPGDFSAAAFLVVAATISPASKVTVGDVGLNPTRTGLLEIAARMGATISAVETEVRGGEPVGALTASYAGLVGVEVKGAVVPRAIDEICIACALAARAAGVTRIQDAAELRVKESDRLAMMGRTLRAFGVGCEEREDGLVIEGRQSPLVAAHVDSGGDHRVAMTAVILALAADGVSKIDNVDCIATSFPGFLRTLRSLGARVDVAGSRGNQVVT